MYPFRFVQGLAIPKQTEYVRKVARFLGSNSQVFLIFRDFRGGNREKYAKFSGF